MKNLLFLSQEKPCVAWHFLSPRMPSALSFSRAAAAQVYDLSGVMKTLEQDVPRFDYDPLTGQLQGLLIEPQRTNYHPHSFAVASWSNVGAILSKTNNVYASPTTEQNAGQIVVDADSKGVYRTVSGLTPNTAYAISGFVKSFAGSSVIKVGAETVEDSPYQGYIAVDTATGSITAYGTKTYERHACLLANGWVHFSYYIKTGAAQTSFNYIALASGGASTFSVWGAQGELGPNATSLIQTNGSAVTRAADLLALTVPNGVSVLCFTFDDASTQNVAVSTGSYTVPVDLNRPHIKRITGL